MKITEEMIYAFIASDGSPAPNMDYIRIGLEAAFKVIDPVPEDVNTIEDSYGDEWIRNSDDPMVWSCDGNSTLCRTYQNIEELWGPITWEGKK